VAESYGNRELPQWSSKPIAIEDDGVSVEENREPEQPKKKKGRLR